MNTKKEITEPLTFVGPVSPAIAYDVVNGMMDSTTLAKTLYSLLTGSITARELSYEIQVIAETELGRIERREPADFNDMEE